MQLALTNIVRFTKYAGSLRFVRSTKYAGSARFVRSTKYAGSLRFTKSTKYAGSARLAGFVTLAGLQEEFMIPIGKQSGQVLVEPFQLTGVSTASGAEIQSAL